MKFKAVSIGKNKGDLIELSPKEKASIAVNEGVSGLQNFEDHHVFVTKVVVSRLDQTTNGAPLRSRWANNLYSAEGKALYHRRHLGSDAVLEPKELGFNIQFKDTLDANGLPEIEILSYSLS